jgi:error-prone DNA polymerase
VVLPELHARSAFSFLRGASDPECLAETAASLGLGTVALLDHDGLYGSPRFERAARAAGVRPLHGATVAVRDPAAGLDGRLALLVCDRAGYQNLCALLTLARLRVSKEAARNGDAVVSLDELGAYKTGLFGLLLAAEAPLAELARRDVSAHREAAWQWARAVVAVMGTDALAVEVTRHHHRPEERRTQRLLRLAEALGVPAVASGDVRFARADEAPLHDVLVCARVHTTVDRAGRRLSPSRAWHLRPPAETAAMFRDLPDTLRAAEAVAARCAFTLADLGYRFPEVSVPAGETAFSWLHKLTHDGARRRYRPLSRQAAAQIARELDLIDRLDLAGYFLLVWDIVRYCREQGILTQGRGSAANSAVCYALGITAVDPVGMGLLFERFLSEERGEWPDIDLDLPSGAPREAVIQYVYATYGPRGAAMTANVITYRARSAVREVGKALGYSEDTLARVAKQLGHQFAEYDRDGFAARMADAGLRADDPRVALWVKLAAELQHLPRHLGQHSGGMVLARGRLDHVVPLEPAAMAGRVVVQWDKDDCAALGILKVDLLGLGMMGVLEEAVATVRAVDGVPVDLAHLPADDARTYAMLQAADTVGVFQVESRAQMATLPRMKPRHFYDLVIEVALIRPGPIVGKMVHPYLARRAGREPVVYPHAELEPVLARTLGVPLFQEQLMRVAMVAAGFTGGEAEELRRAMGSKRSVARMAALEARLRAGMTARGYAVPVQDDVVRGITSFALYGFPESHAASFALIVYASAYLRAHFPATYCAALLNHWPMGFYHPATVVKDAQRHGVRIAPIDVTRSDWGCTREGVPSEQRVRLGLKYVRGLREMTGAALVAARAQGAFRSLDDFRRRVRPNAAELEALAEVGALTHTDPSRPWHRREALWQVHAFAAVPAGGVLDAVDVARDEAPVPAMTLAERVAADYRVTGLTAGPHPMALLREGLTARGIVPVAEFARGAHGAGASVAGVVITRQKPPTAKGFFFVTLEDETGLLNAIVKPALYTDLRAVLTGAPALVLHGVTQRQEGVLSLSVVTAEALPLGRRRAGYAPVSEEEGGEESIALPRSYDFR